MVDLARLDQLFAVAPAEIHAIPFFAVEREPGDSKRLTHGTGLFHPIVDATRCVPAVADLRDDALKTSLAGVLVHLATIDLEALAELDVGLGDDLLERGLTLEQRQIPQVVAVEVKQVEGDYHDLFGSPLEFVLQHREVRGAVLCRDHDLVIDDRRSGIDVPGIGCDLSETVGPVIAAPGEYLDSSVPEMDLDPVTLGLD